MVSFRYTVTDEMGIHARPAGQFVKRAAQYQSSVTLTRAGTTVDAKKIFKVMALAVKCGETVEIAIDGPDEAEAAEVLQAFMQQNL